MSENPTNRTKKPRSAGSEAGLSRGFAEMRVTANPPRQYHINGCTAAAFRSWTRRAVRGIGWEFVHPCIDDVLFVVGFSRCACARPPAIGQAVALHGIDASSGAAPAARPYGSGGCIALERVVGGLHHDYCQIYFSIQTAFAYPTATKKSAAAASCRSLCTSAICAAPPRSEISSPRVITRSSHALPWTSAVQVRE